MRGVFVDKCAFLRIKIRSRTCPDVRKSTDEIESKIRMSNIERLKLVDDTNRLGQWEHH